MSRDTAKRSLTEADHWARGTRLRVIRFGGLQNGLLEC